MADKVVLDGELSPVLPFDGDLNLSVPMDGEVGIITNIGGGGAPAVLVEKSVSANGVYNASADSADGYSKVTVAVPASAVDTGTKSITSNGVHSVVGYASADVNVPTGITPTGTVSITANGVTDVTAYASADVNVPNTYTSADEGKVVDGGALVSQTSLSVTENDTYDTTTVNEVTVNVSGGGGGAVGAVNILDGVSVVPGYLASNGSISAQSSTSREITTDYIDVSAHVGEDIYLLLGKNGGQPWAAMMAYSASYAAVGSRVTIQGSNDSKVIGDGAQFTIPSGATYIRLSFRTYGNARYAATIGTDGLAALFAAMASDGWSAYTYA